MSNNAKLNSLALSAEYRTVQTNMMKDFYIPCLKSSIVYDRAVGFFKSTVFSLISDEIIAFAKRGGRIRIICSPILSEVDIQAMQNGYKTREQIISYAIENEINEILSNTALTSHSEILATLISLNILDVKIAVWSTPLGMYHEKLGIFKDLYGNAVSFKGSANETWNGWHHEGNYESIETFCSWSHSADAERTNRHIKYFNDLWGGLIPCIDTLDFPTAARKKLCQIAKNDLDEIELIRRNDKSKSTSVRRLFEHQENAIENWKLQGFRGILHHATGSGKTFTAITAIKEHISSGGAALVLVPSKLLLRQWEKELQSEIPNLYLLKAGDSNNDWKAGDILSNFTVYEPSSKPRIVLATMQTASSQLFIEKLAMGEHLLLVADEVHQTGSRENSKLYKIDAGKRLGLSATPMRYGDPEGTARMFEYFGQIVEPVFTLKDAILAGRLVEYEYYPHEISLNTEEAESWKKFSDQISREIIRSPKDSDGNYTISDRVRMLLIRRSRVAKKAQAKIHLAKTILLNNYKDGEKWLVYCEDQEQLGMVLESLRKTHLLVNEYHTSMKGDMNATLDWFKRHGGILVSIRCLDEGIDIPDISHALILASSQNPRQFIQRRGRVLRKVPDKLKATLHDAVVVPVDYENEPEQLALIKSEFCRALEFAENAINKSSAMKLIRIAINLNLDIKELSQVGFELEDE